MTPFQKACAALEAAKIAEAEAISARYDAEAAVIAYASTRDEGAVTVRDGAWKATVTTVVNRRFDEAALAAIRDRIPDALFDQAVRYKPEPRMEGVRYLRNNEPEMYAVLAEALIATPGKTQVRVERLAEQRRAA